ncbi:MAG: hypothetical protein ACERKV_08660 [Clostridiaceae bacterium]
MELIDIRKLGKINLSPICRWGNILLLKKTAGEGPLYDKEIIGYYTYNIHEKKLKSIEIGQGEVIYDSFNESYVEGEDKFYFTTFEEQVFVNDMILKKVDVETGLTKDILNFNLEKKYNSLIVEKLKEGVFIVFYKEEPEYTEEYLDFLSEMNYDKDRYGFEGATLFDTINDEKYEINDKFFLRGLKSIFFKTKLKGEMCIVTEENYIEPYEKEQFYVDVHMNRLAKKDKFYYRDYMKYISLDKFIQEIEEGAEKISFIDIEGYDLEGYEMFSGVDEKNIYYIKKVFGQENSEAIVSVDKETLNKKEIVLPSQYAEDMNSCPPMYMWNLAGNNKYIFNKKSISRRKVKLKQVINGNMEYIYESKLGQVKEFVENRYLIISDNMDGYKTSIIDITNNKVKTFKRNNKAFDDVLVLY